MRPAPASTRSSPSKAVRTVVGTGAPEMNPLVNPGAISATSMVTGATADEVWKKIIGFHNDAAGRPLSVLQDVYKSESDTNQRNQAIGVLMLAYGYIKNNWQQAVDLYTRQCSIGVNAKDLATMAATLASGGKNPVTGKQVLDASKVPGVLAVMATAGLYDDSGKWLYHTGPPRQERRRRRHPRRLARQVRHRRRVAAARRRRQQRARAARDRRHLERARRQSVCCEGAEQQLNLVHLSSWKGEPGNVPWLVAFMDWLAQSLRQNVELALFLSIAPWVTASQPAISGLSARGRYWVPCSPATGRQAGIAVPAAMQSAFFLLFLFAIGSEPDPILSWAAIERLATNRLDRVPLRRGARPDLDVGRGTRPRWWHGGWAGGGRADELDGARDRDRAASTLGDREWGTPGEQRRDRIRAHLLPRDAARGVVSAGDWSAADARQLMDACKELERTMGIGGCPRRRRPIRRDGGAPGCPGRWRAARFVRWRTCARPRLR